MKNRNLSVCVLALVVTMLVSSCASLGGSFKLKQTRQDVDWAMVGWHNRITFGLTTPQEQQRVSDAYKAYLTAFNAAVKQANGNYQSPTPANVKMLADQLFSILDSIP